MSQHDTLTLRDALRNIQYEAASLADAQVVALQALNATYPARAALSATQPAQAKQSEPAEHWHRLYLEKCQQYNDRVAQLGGVIEGLEAQAAQGVGDKVLLVATGEIYEGQETYERYEGSPPPLCDYEVLYTVPQPAVAQGASEVFTALADHCPVDNGWFNGRAAQAAADARDAERYRWLRDQANTSVNIDIGAGCEISDTLDAAIDAVLATHQQRQDRAAIAASGRQE